MNLLTTLTPNEDEKISVVGKYNPRLITGDKFAGLDENLNVILRDDFENFYYGISTKLTATLLIDTISSLRIQNRKDLEDFIKEHHDLFMFHQQDKDKLKDFAYSAVISLLNMYGVTVVFNNENEYKECPEEYKPYIKDNKLAVRGAVDEALLEFLRKYRYNIWDKEARVSDSGKTIEEVYKDKKNIVLLSHRLFYSGCLLKAIKIEKKDAGNVNTVSYNVFFERTSFAAVYSLNKFTPHKYLEGNKFYESLEEDDKVAYKFYKDLEESNGENLEAINEYLKNTISGVQMGISGMFETKDGYIILPKRDAKEYDSNQYYPSVNGNAEIDDPNVDLYEDSVSEDCPTVYLNDSRIDFLGEINREAYAELKISTSQSGWDCLGIAICGNANKEKVNYQTYDDPERRMQLNIVYKQSVEVNKSLKDIRKLQKEAVEKYEAKYLEGLYFKVYKSAWHRLGYLIQYLGKAVSEIKGIVTTGVSLALFLVLLFNRGSIGGPVEVVSQFLSLFVFIISLVKLGLSIFEFFKNRVGTKTYFAVKGINAEKKIEKIVDKRFKGSNKLHPVTYVSLLLMLRSKNK